MEHICNLAGSFVQMIMLMHQAKIIHCDIKHSNIGVVGTDIRPFDMDCSIRNPELNFSGTVPMMGGTYKTMAPEQICDKQCCFASDMWAVGLVLLQALLDSESYKSFYKRYLVALSYYEHESKVKCNKSYDDLKTADMSKVTEGLKFCPHISQEFGEKMVGFVMKNLLVIDHTKRATAEQWVTLMISTEGIKDHTCVDVITTYDPVRGLLDTSISQSPQENLNSPAPGSQDTSTSQSPHENLNRSVSPDIALLPGLYNRSTDCFVNALIVNVSVLMDDSEVLFKKSQKKRVETSKTYQMLLDLVMQFKDGKDLVRAQDFRKRFGRFVSGQHDLVAWPLTMWPMLAWKTSVPLEQNTKCRFSALAVRVHMYYKTSYNTLVCYS
jgi:serine/threonine protein kinase